MQGPGTNNAKSSDEDVHSKKSSKISPRTKTEVSVEIESNIRSASRTEESPRTISNLESDLKTNSEIKDDVLLSEDSRRHGEESSAATIFSKRSVAPETISEAIKSRYEPSSRGSERKSNVTNPEDDDTTIDEVIRISDERSEIISELSNAIDKDDHEDEDASNVSSIDEQKLQYENDTFEEASSSTSSTSSTELHLKKSSEELAQGTVISGVKEIKITSLKHAEIIQEKVINDEK